jgi:hypothetical protein
MSDAPSPTETARPDPAPCTIRLEDIDKSNLAGAGNYLWRHTLPDGLEVVIKVYYGSRSPFLYMKKTFGNVVLTGRSSHMPKARCAMEAASVRAWEAQGFRCFGMYPQIEVEGLPRDGYMVFEYVPGRHFRDYFLDPEVPLDEKRATWVRFLPEWHRRHAAAIATNDSKLIHENGDVKHVMLWQGDFVYFDFEMIYTSKDVSMLVGREIACYMRSVGRFYGEEAYEWMTDELVEHYPDKALLMNTWRWAFDHTDGFTRFVRKIDYAVKPSNKKRFSKYRVAQDIKRRLDERSLTRPEPA